MSNLDKIFAPTNVAVIGASCRAGSVGNTVLRNLLAGGFRGAIYPVNPKHKQLLELECYASVAKLPNVVDLAIICTPAMTVPSVVEQCGLEGINGVIILSAGFREAGEAGRELENRLVDVRNRFPELRIVGPNCLGILSPHQCLNASFASDMPPAGNIAFISQSGALCTAILDWAILENVGFSQFVSIGNMLDVTFTDLIEYFAEDANTEAILMYVESLTEAQSFLSAARSFTETKPIIAYKAGRFAESALAAASHTGAMAGVDSVYETAFSRAGIVRVFEIEDLFDTAELLAKHPSTCGDRLAIVTNAGGPGVMATDALLSCKGSLANLSEETIRQLDATLPTNWSRHNPVDVIGDATPERFSSAVQSVVNDPAVDAILIILSPQAMTDPTGCADAVCGIAGQTTKPVLTSWMGGSRVAEGIQHLNDAGIPTYSTPEKCIRVFMHLARYSRNRAALHETPAEAPITFSLSPEQRRALVFQGASSLLSEHESKRILDAYGIPVSTTRLAHTAREAESIADTLGYPVALKVFATEITHKTDVEGVELNVKNASEVDAAFTSIMQRVKDHRPDAKPQGVTVQPMVIEALSCELIVGAKRDPVFGPVLLVGAGGITAELYHDRALELPPLNKRLAHRMLESLQIWPLLSGYRSRPGLNVDKVVDVLLRLSQMVTECPEIMELDINPLLATEKGVIALDARVLLDCSGSDTVLETEETIAKTPL